MSVNKYNATTGELENIASGQRTVIYTKAAYDAAKQAGTLPTNCMVVITDDISEDIEKQISASDWQDSTYYTLVTADSRRYVIKKGNVCQIFFLVKVAQVATTWTTVLTGLPEPAQPSIGTFSLRYKGYDQLEWSISSQNGSGYISLRTGDTASASTSGYYFNISYITKE